MEMTLEEALQKALEAHRMGEVEVADRFYTAILQSQPRHPAANHNLGKLAVDIGKVKEALPFFKTAVESNPNISQFWHSYIDTLIKLDRKTDSLAALEQAKSNGVKGEILGKLEDRIKKLDANTRQTDLDNREIEVTSKIPNIPKEQLQSLTKLYSQGFHQEVIHQAVKMLKKFPSLPILYNICGAAHAGLGEFESAINNYKKAIKIKPDFAEALNNMGVALRATDKIDLAIESYEKAIAAKTDYAEAYDNLGNILASKGKIQAARDSYKKSLAINPHSAMTHYNIGLMLSAQDDHQSAIQSFRAAIRLNPEFAEAHNNLGISLTKVGKINESLSSYKRAVKIDPRYAGAHNNIANIRKSNGDVEHAIKSLEKAIEANPSYAEAYYNLGNVLLEMKKYSDAIVCYKKAISLKPYYFEAHSNLGLTLGELGQLNKAEICYRKAIMLKPDYVSAHSQLGGILNRLGKINDAKFSYSQALSLDPKHIDANYNYGLMLLEIGKFGEAAKHFEVCGTDLSESYLLRCFYLENKKAKFYEQLDKLVDQAICNAMVGSFASRAKIRYGIETPNPFCGEPLEYVKTVDLNNVCDFDITFIAACKSILNDENTTYRNQNLISNGKQTAGNLFAINNRPLDEIEKVIRKEVEKYRYDFIKNKEGIFQNWPNDYSINCWIVSMKSGGELAPHIHERGWLSGSIYINVPTKNKSDSGNLIVCIDSVKYQSGEAEGKNIDVFTGAMCLFPSSLLHYTIPFASDEDRIVLAFDIIPKAIDA